VSAASVRPTARELLVIPDNTSRSSVLQKTSLQKQQLPPEPSTPSHSIDPFQSIVTRESPTRQVPQSGIVKKNSPTRSTKPSLQVAESSPQDIRFIPNNTRDTKARATNKPPPRHQGDLGPGSVEPPVRRSESPYYSVPPPFVESESRQHSVVSSVAPPSVVVPPATTTTPHTTEEQHPPKKHHKKKKKKRTSKTKESTSKAAKEVTESTTASKEKTSTAKESESRPRESSKEPRVVAKQPPSYRAAKPTTTSKEARASKFKPRLSQKAFSMFSIETPQPCSKSGMKFEELYKLKGVVSHIFLFVCVIDETAGSNKGDRVLSSLRRILYCHSQQ